MVKFVQIVVVPKPIEVINLVVLCHFEDTLIQEFRCFMMQLILTKMWAELQLMPLILAFSNTIISTRMVNIDTSYL